jgi:hypothetical protein
MALLVFLLNSSVAAFIETFLLFDQVLGPGGTVPAGLGDRLRVVDAKSFERSEWRALLEYMAGGA